MFFRSGCARASGGALRTPHTLSRRRRASHSLFRCTKHGLSVRPRRGAPRAARARNTLQNRASTRGIISTLSLAARGAARAYPLLGQTGVRAPSSWSPVLHGQAAREGARGAQQHPSTRLLGEAARPHLGEVLRGREKRAWGALGAGAAPRWDLRVLVRAGLVSRDGAGGSRA